MQTIREAGTLNRTGHGRILVRVIDQGEGSSGTYSPEVLERAATERAFPRGTQMHLDHSTATDRMDRPEGSLRNLVGVLTEDARYEGGALVAEALIGSQWREFINDFHEFIGVSISAAAEIRETDQGRVVERIVPDPFNRADFVTVPGRGGKVTAVLEAARRAAETAPTDPTDSPTTPAGETTNKEDASMADTTLTEAQHRAEEADRRAHEADTKAGNLAAENEKLKARIAELEATIAELKAEKANAAKEARQAAAVAAVREAFGEDAPAFLVDAAKHAAEAEDFDADAHTVQVREAAQALSPDPSTPTVAHTTEAANTATDWDARTLAVLSGTHQED